MLCVLSGRGLCDELITHPEESHRLWCVVVRDLENLKNEEAINRAGSQRHSKKKVSAILQRHLKIITEESRTHCNKVIVTLLDINISKY